MTENDKVMSFRVSNLEADVNEIRVAIKSIDQSLQILARLEERHVETRESIGRAFKLISDHEARMRTVEADMPTMRLVRGWVIAGVIGVMAITGAGVLSTYAYQTKQIAQFNQTQSPWQPQKTK